ncbi:MAG: hypothetical protein F6K54_14740 [Okeania sp. SIO3B5]|uniref:hypothetical protein n=1 Tax=Okeania sp. SIO3B5 TaxID=2607811 RepID=UPI0014010F65|nr:hypothetical protein [Okeania sp. SIO3B5]NEO54227.1 hypothetical protein [Okeania sp. SIO3B5]
MPDPEIINKLEGLTYNKANVKIIGGLAGEGKEFVVFNAINLSSDSKVVIHFYQSNPMFLLNEVDFDFLPDSGNFSERINRHEAIMTKLLLACEREHPGLFFLHMKFIYARILLELCRDFEVYQTVVQNTTNMVFQNEEFVEFSKITLNRITNSLSNQSLPLELDDWEYRIRRKESFLTEVIQFLEKEQKLHFFNPNTPTSLLALVFSEGFFGTIPKDENNNEDSFFGDLTSDSPSKVIAEDRLKEFLDDLEYREIIPNLTEEIDKLKITLAKSQDMLTIDAFYEDEWLKNLGYDFLPRYRAGRNTLLRGLPRFLRTINAHVNSGFE